MPGLLLVQENKNDHKISSRKYVTGPVIACVKGQGEVPNNCNFGNTFILFRLLNNNTNGSLSSYFSANFIKKQDICLSSQLLTYCPTVMSSNFSFPNVFIIYWTPLNNSYLYSELLQCVVLPLTMHQI